MQRKVRQAFAEIEAVVKKGGEEATRWTTIDAAVSVEEVAEQVRREVQQTIQLVQNGRKEIGGLWDGAKRDV